MPIKIDIEETIDQVNWKFLILCLECLGFSVKWCDPIFSCISTASCSINVNVSVFGRMGPFSPFLYHLYGVLLKFFSGH